MCFITCVVFLSTDCRKEGSIDHMVAFMKTYQTHTTHQQQPQPIQSRKQQQQQQQQHQQQ